MEGNNSNDSVNLAVNLAEGAVASQPSGAVPHEYPKISAMLASGTGGFLDAEKFPQVFEQSAAGQSKMNVPEERAAFEGRWEYLNFERNLDLWGREQYAHAHVQAIWQGWLSRAQSGIKSNEPQAT